MEFIIAAAVLAAICVGVLAIADKIAINLGCSPNAMFWLGMLIIVIGVYALA